jgi:hypothetical protein
MLRMRSVLILVATLLAGAGSSGCRGESPSTATVPTAAPAAPAASPMATTQGTTLPTAPPSATTMATAPSPPTDEAGGMATGTATLDLFGDQLPLTNIKVVETTLESSPYHSILLLVQNALDHHDTQAILNWLFEFQESLVLVPGENGGDSPWGVARLDVTLAREILDWQFRLGSHPTIEGYVPFRMGQDGGPPGPGQAPCVAIVIKGIAGSFSIPTPTPTPTLPPGATEEPGIEGDFFLPALAAPRWVWHFCGGSHIDPTGWTWHYDWVYGTSHDQVVASQTDAHQSDTYYAIRPAEGAK